MIKKFDLNIEVELSERLIRMRKDGNVVNAYTVHPAEAGDKFKEACEKVQEYVDRKTGKVKDMDGEKA